MSEYVPSFSFREVRERGSWSIDVKVLKFPEGEWPNHFCTDITVAGEQGSFQVDMRFTNLAQVLEYIYRVDTVALPALQIKDVGRQLARLVIRVGDIFASANKELLAKEAEVAREKNQQRKN